MPLTIGDQTRADRFFPRQVGSDEHMCDSVHTAFLNTNTIRLRDDSAVYQRPALFQFIRSGLQFQDLYAFAAFTPITVPFNVIRGDNYFNTYQEPYDDGMSIAKSLYRITGETQGFWKFTVRLGLAIISSVEVNLVKTVVNEDGFEQSTNIATFAKTIPAPLPRQHVVQGSFHNLFSRGSGDDTQHDFLEFNDHVGAQFPTMSLPFEARLKSLTCNYIHASQPISFQGGTWTVELRTLPPGPSTHDASTLKKTLFQWNGSENEGTYPSTALTFADNDVETHLPAGTRFAIVGEEFGTIVPGGTTNAAEALMLLVFEKVENESPVSYHDIAFDTVHFCEPNDYISVTFSTSKQATEGLLNNFEGTSAEFTGHQLTNITQADPFPAAIPSGDDDDDDDEGEGDEGEGDGFTEGEGESTPDGAEESLVDNTDPSASAPATGDDAEASEGGSSGETAGESGAAGGEVDFAEGEGGGEGGSGEGGGG